MALAARAAALPAFFGALPFVLTLRASAATVSAPSLTASAAFETPSPVSPATFLAVVRVSEPIESAAFPVVSAAFDAVSLTAVAVAARGGFAFVAVPASASGSMERRSRTEPSVPWTTRRPPPSLAMISTARVMASAWVLVRALGRRASSFSTVQPSSTGLTWRSAMAGSSPVRD